MGLRPDRTTAYAIVHVGLALPSGNFSWPIPSRGSIFRPPSILLCTTHENDHMVRARCTAVSNQSRGNSWTRGLAGLRKPVKRRHCLHKPKYQAVTIGTASIRLMSTCAWCGAFVHNAPGKLSIGLLMQPHMGGIAATKYHVPWTSCFLHPCAKYGAPPTLSQFVLYNEYRPMK